MISGALGCEARMKGWGTSRLVLAFALLVAGVGCGGARAVDLHKTAWLSVALPGSICGASGVIHLRDGVAVLRSNRWPGWQQGQITDSWMAHADAPVYGKLGGSPAGG